MVAARERIKCLRISGEVAFTFFFPPTAVNKACQDASSQVENISEVHLAYLCFSLLERVENSKPTMKNLKVKLLLSLHFS